MGLNDTSNYGLLNNIASGLHEGLLAMQTTQNMNRQNQMMNLLYGVQPGADGTLQYTPEKQEELAAQRKTATLKAQAEQQDYAPASDNEIGLLKTHLNKVTPGSGDSLDGSKLTHHQIVEQMGLLNPDIKGQYEVQSAYAKANAGQGGNTPKFLSDQTNKMSQDLDPNRMRSGNLGKSQAMINASDRINGLISQFPDGNIPKGQSHELAAAVASMVSGGSPQSQQQINDIVPSSAKGSAEDIAAWVTNNPNGRDQKAFIDMLKHTSDRERDIAEEQVKAAQVQKLGGYQLLKKNAPDQFSGVLSSYGITPDMVDESGRYVPKSKRGGGTSGLLNGSAGSAPSGVHPEDSAAVAWAKANPKDSRSAAILKANGL